MFELKFTLLIKLFFGIESFELVVEFFRNCSDDKSVRSFIWNDSTRCFLSEFKELSKGEAGAWLILWIDWLDGLRNVSFAKNGVDKSISLKACFDKGCSAESGPLPFCNFNHTFGPNLNNFMIAKIITQICKNLTLKFMIIVIILKRVL